MPAQKQVVLVLAVRGLVKRPSLDFTLECLSYEEMPLARGKSGDLGKHGVFLDETVVMVTFVVFIISVFNDQGTHDQDPLLVPLVRVGHYVVCSQSLGLYVVSFDGVAGELLVDRARICDSEQLHLRLLSMDRSLHLQVVADDCLAVAEG